MLRFAPSPTGDMHIGDLRVAIINYLVSQQKNEQFIIRIEDREKEKNIEGKDTEIMQILEKFALKHESVFHQSEHLHMHQTLAIKLLEEGKAFVCTCQEDNEDNNCYSGNCFNVSKAEHDKLKKSATPFVIRIKKPQSNIISKDIIAGENTTSPDEVDSFVILKTNGTPTYNFACACDDMLSGVNFIIRGEENLLNTPKQIHIKKQLGYEEETIYAHLATILDSEDKSIEWLFKEGYTPDAIINYLILIGNIEVPKEIFTLPEAIEWFNIENISKNSVKFDLEKLRFINAQHIKMMDDKQLSTLFNFADEDIGRLAKLYLQEVSTVKELREKIESIFSPKDFSNKWGEEMRVLESIIQNAPMINSFDDFKTYIQKKSGLDGEKLMKPLTLLLTGYENSPKLNDIYPLIKSYILEVAS